MDLPDYFDLIVVGTGLTESLVAAACARAGQKVLHLDSNSHYGSRCASFNLRQMDAWLREGAASPAATDGASEQPRISITPDSPSDVSFMPSEAADGAPSADLLAAAMRYNIDLTPQLLLCAGDMVGVLRSSGVSSYLEFKPVQARAAFLRTATHSPAHPHPELTRRRRMQAHLYGASSELQRVPCGKADIFQSTAISLADKRHLMKFLQSCLALQPQLEPVRPRRPPRRPAPRRATPRRLSAQPQHAPGRPQEVSQPLQALAAPDAAPVAPVAAGLDGSFDEFLRRQRLSAALRDVALYAILQLPRPVSPRHPGPAATDGVRAVCAHLRSLGVYGPTAYLACYYGSGELPQAFCRLCAVWGGVYMLQQAAVQLELESADEAGEGASPAAATAPARRVRAVVDGEGRRTKCKWLLLNGDNRIEPPGEPGGGGAVEAAAEAEAAGTIARCVCVLDKPLIPSRDEDGVPAGLRTPSTQRPVCPPGTPPGSNRAYRP